MFIQNSSKENLLFNLVSESNPFGKVEPDEVIEVIVNRDTKTPGGTTGVSTNRSAINRWILNAPFRADVHTALHDFVHMRHKAHQHKDLSAIRIKKDENDINTLLTVNTLHLRQSIF